MTCSWAIKGGKVAVCMVLAAACTIPLPLVSAPCAQAKVLNATKGSVKLTGKLTKEYQTTSDTVMTWSCVVYWLNFSKPVKIKFNLNGDVVTKKFKRIHVESVECQGNSGLYQLKIAKWEKRLGKRITIKGGVCNTNNAHTRGLARMTSPKIVKTSK